MNNTYIKHYAEEDSLTHYGVKGMKWRKHKRRDIEREYLEIERDEDGDAVSGTWRTANSPMTADMHTAAEKIRGAAMQNKARKVRDAKEAGYKLKMNIRYNHTRTENAKRSIKKMFKKPVAFSKRATSKGQSIIKWIKGGRHTW